jgi:putative drug exporter of the RND superfamily
MVPPRPEPRQWYLHHPGAGEFTLLTGDRMITRLDDMSTSNPLTRLPARAATWSATHPWRAIALWFAFVAASVALAVAVPTVSTTQADYRLGESGRADQLSDQGRFPFADSENALFTGGRPAEAERAADQLTTRLRTTPGVTTVAPPQWSRDRSALLLSWSIKEGVDDAAPMRAAVSAVQRQNPGLSVREAGDLTVDDAINARVGDDLGAAEIISLPVTLILMLLAFGALVAAGIPVLLAGTSVAATIGLSAPISHLIHAEPTVTSMIVLIGMAVGVDYSLFYLKRERAERAAGRTTLDAVEIAARTSGHSILVSGGAVIVSMTGLFIMGGATFDSLAAGAIVVVAMAVLGSITVLPALLVKLGRWTDRPRVPLLWRLNRRIGSGGMSGRVLRPVLRHPRTALVVSVLIVGGLAVPALGMRTHNGNLDTLPGSIAEVSTLRQISAAFPGEGPTARVVVRSADEQAAGRALGNLREKAVATGDFTAVGDVDRSRDISVLTLAMPFPESDQRIDTAVRELRSELVPATLTGRVAEYAVGGDAAESLDYSDRQSTRLPLVLGFVLTLTLLIMLAAFRSVPIAVVSTVLNLASVGAAFGIVTLVFQHGVAASWLGLSSPGFLIDWLPLFIMVVLIGLSMDYHVFVVGRIRELVRSGQPTRIAVENGLRDTAGVVTSAAAVMVSVFAIFATLSMVEMQMMGIGLSAAILLDATVVRLVMLPAILVLLGERAWWPAERPVETTTRVEPVLVG